MPILNYTTSVTAERTVDQLTKMLVANKASAILTEFEDGRPVGLAFKLKTANGPSEYSLPCRWRQVQAVLFEQRVEPRYRGDEHCLNVAWRILKDWTEAQIAIVQAGLVTVDEVFLPYRLIAPGQTVYQRMVLQLEDKG